MAVELSERSTNALTCVNCCGLGLFTAVNVIGQPFASRFRYASSPVSVPELELVENGELVLKMSRNGCSGVKYVTCCKLMPKGDAELELDAAHAEVATHMPTISVAETVTL